MSTTENEIKEFLEDNFQTGLIGYFDNNKEQGEKAIVDRVGGKGSSPPPFIVDEDSRGYGKRYSVRITVVKAATDELPGQLLRNRSRIESNLLTAIRKLITENQPHWNASVIGKVTVEVK